MRTRTAAFILVLASGLTACVTQMPVLGGYSRVAISNEDVMRAAAFAAEAEQEVMREAEGTPAVLVVVAVTAGEQQVVAGLKYRLDLKVKINGVEKDAEAVVWWQPWRSPDPYRLLSWTWK